MAGATSCKRPESHTCTTSRGRAPWNYSDLPLCGHRVRHFPQPERTSPAEAGFYDGASAQDSQMLLFRDVAGAGYDQLRRIAEPPSDRNRAVRGKDAASRAKTVAPDSTDPHSRRPGCPVQRSRGGGASEAGAGDMSGTGRPGVSIALQPSTRTDRDDPPPSAGSVSGRTTVVNNSRKVSADQVDPVGAQRVHPPAEDLARPRRVVDPCSRTASSRRP